MPNKEVDLGLHGEPVEANTTRVTLTIPTEVKLFLDHIGNSHKMNQTDLIIEAITARAHVQEAEREGGALVFRDDQDRIVRPEADAEFWRRMYIENDSIFGQDISLPTRITLNLPIELKRFLDETAKTEQKTIKNTLVDTLTIYSRMQDIAQRGGTSNLEYSQTTQITDPIVHTIIYPAGLDTPLRKLTIEVNDTKNSTPRRVRYEPNSIFWARQAAKRNGR